jgi:cobalt-zinc-cadmium resistance protein CzcA
MITRIVDTSLDNRALVIVLWLLVASGGLEALRTLPIDAVPDVTNVQVQVLTNSPGLAPEEVERLVTVPVEHAMSGLPDLAEVRSVSKFGLSVVTVVFEDGTHPDWARQRVGERLSAARGEIPPGYGEPELGPVSSGLGEIYQFEVRGEPACAPGTNDTPTCYSPLELREILDWFVVPQLRAVRGVVEVNAFGGELKTWQVTVDPEKLAARGIAIGEVFAALQANNRNAGGGYIEHHGEQYLVRGEGLVERPEDIADVVLRVDADGAPVHVHDVARVTFAPMLRQGAVTRDGRGEAVVGIVMMLAGENARTVVDRVKERAAALRQGMPPGVTLDVFYDRTELVRSTIATVARNLAFGGLLVVLVLLLLLGNLRAGLIVAVSIPLSMLVAFIGMRAVGLSGNLMSLGAIDFGLIVDGSVVMIENIVRVLSHPAGAGETRTERVRAAARQVARPVVFAVGVIVIVYLPLLALRGVEGRMFVPMALTVVFALAGSLVCALTLMPVLASLFLYRVSERPSRLFALARRLYAPALNRAMSHPRRTAGLAAVAFVGSLGIAPFLGAEFIPRLDEGAIALQIWRLPSVSLSQSNALSTLAEQVLVEQFPNEVSTVVSRTGRAEIATDPMGVEISDVYVMLQPREGWRFDSKDALIAALNDALKKNVPGAVFSYSQPIELRVAELISGVRSDVAVHVYGDDLAMLKAKGDEIAAGVERGPRGGGGQSGADGRPAAPARAGRPPCAGALRPQCRGGPRRRSRPSGGKRAGTILEGQTAVRPDWCGSRPKRAAIPTGSAICAIIGPAPDGGTRLIPLSQLAEIEVEDGPGADQPRPPQPAHQRRGQRARARSRLLRARGPGPGGGRGPGPGGLDRGVGRAVREPGGGVAAARDPRAAGPGPDLRAAVHGVRLRGPGRSGLLQRAPGHHGRPRRAVGAGLPAVHLGGGGLHRAVRRGGAERRRAGVLRRGAAGSGPGAGRRGPGRRANAPAPRADDRARGLPGFRADGPGHERGSRGAAARWPQWSSVGSSPRPCSRSWCCPPSTRASGAGDRPQAFRPGTSPWPQGDAGTAAGHPEAGTGGALLPSLAGRDRRCWP